MHPGNERFPSLPAQSWHTQHSRDTVLNHMPLSRLALPDLVSLGKNAAMIRYAMLKKGTNTLARTPDSWGLRKNQKPLNTVSIFQWVSRWLRFAECKDTSRAGKIEVLALEAPKTHALNRYLKRKGLRCISISPFCRWNGFEHTLLVLRWAVDFASFCYNDLQCT